MALPLDKDIIAVGGSEVPSGLANNLQDMIIGARHGSEEFLWPAAGGVAVIGTESHSGSEVIAGTDTLVYDRAIEKIPVGARFTGGNIYYERPVGGTMTWDIVVSDLTGTFSETITQIASVNAGTGDAVVVASFSPITIAQTSHVFIRWTAALTGNRWHAIGLIFDH